MLHKGYNYIYINEYKNRGAYTAILAASLKVRQYRLLQGFYLFTKKIPAANQILLFWIEGGQCIIVSREKFR